MEVDTEFYKGQVTAVCMENPLYDVIIGNVANVIDNVLADELLSLRQWNKLIDTFV